MPLTTLFSLSYKFKNHSTGYFESSRLPNLKTTLSQCVCTLFRISCELRILKANDLI